ncbi:MAG: FAD:protein FMN transferase [Verrucomicrobiales bacterium]|nr:FAD:protein FMN transferase [Verrucomicrobiales bacterium]
MNQIKRCQPLLGTFVEITLEGPQSAETLHHWAGKAFELISSVGRMMSFHDASSDISRLNRCAHISPIHVHPWTHEVIRKAVKLSADTEGAFDVTVAPKLVQMGYLPRHRPFVTLNDAGMWTDIDLLEGGNIFFRKPLMIDLGGIAKGFAVDKAIDWLSSHALTSAVVNAGGDLRVFGSGPHSFAIRNPAAPQESYLPAEMLRPSVATSAAYFSRKRHGLERVSPIVHPVTGKSLRSNRSVSVFAPTCIQADALTKAVLLAPQALWSRVLREANSLALFVTQRGERVLFPA